MNYFQPTNNSFSWTFVAVVILLIASLLPRIYELGKIGFQKDEEYTAFSSMAIIEGKSAEMPSGMPYRRALPLTYLSAGTAKLFGVNKESSYRLPAVIIGALSPAILFLLFRSTIGGVTALIAALMLAFSEWHILLSREARMYAPFLLFYMCTAFYTWRWVKTNNLKYLMASIILFAISATLHKLTLLAAIFPLIPLITNSKTAVPPIRAIGLSAIFIILGFAYHNFFVGAGYEVFIPAEQGAQAAKNFEHRYTDVLNKIPIANPTINLLLIATGAFAGYWLAQSRKMATGKLSVPLLSTLAYYSLAIMTGIFTFTGLIYAATLTGILFFAIETGLPPTRLKAIQLPAGLLTLTALFWVSSSVLQYGLHDGVKTLASFPFPYFAHLASISPGLVFLFICAGTYLITNNRNISDGLRFAIIATIIPVFVIGATKEWGAARYLIGTYPFLIITAAISLVMFIESLGNKTGWWSNRGTALLAVIITISGILGGNGIPTSIVAVTLDYGEADYWPTLALHPDHQSAGHFVRDRLQISDIVVAEDASMQKWYAGKVDFWLRSFDDAKAYLYRADDGNLRDIYVNSRIVTPEILETLDTMASNGQRIWVITSAETYKKRSYYLGEQQLLWLQKIEHTFKPVHIGRDGITKVYCLDCKSSQLEQSHI